MGCCGGKRQQYQTYAGTVRRSARPAPDAAAPRVFFEYVGGTAIAVIGPVSGLRYVFDGPGARAEVDPRDRRALAGVAGLREIL